MTFVCIKILASTNILLALFAIVSPSPPPEPIRCSPKSSGANCAITNSYGAFPDRATCMAARAVFPTSEDELVEEVARAASNGQKIKVATRFSHSIPKLVCANGQDGLLISTKYLNKVLMVDFEAQTMTVESGVTLEQLIKEAAKAGLALPYSPYWWGLTVGGMLGTGAHGSSLWGKGSAVHEYVVEMRIVSPAGPEDGYVRVRQLSENDEELNAAKISLGVLGVVSQKVGVSISSDMLSAFLRLGVSPSITFLSSGTEVTLKLQPMFKRSITYTTKDDHDLGDQALTFGDKHEFGDMTWYPSQRKVVYRRDDRVSTDVPGNGLSDFTGFRATASIALATIRTTEESQDSIRNTEGKCIDSKLTTSLLKNTAYGLTNNGVLFTGYPVIGYQNRLQASGTCIDGPEDALITTCPWDPRVKGQFFHQTTFSLPIPKAKSFIQDIQKLVNLEPKALCGLELYNGILMRYVKGSSAYLGKQEDSLDFDITYYRSKDPLAPRLHEDILEEIEQIGLFKYGALPHWGKNRNLAFDGVTDKYKNAAEFLKVKGKYDPMGLFSSEWTDQILGPKRGVTIDREGCALEGLCVCSQDTHCSPRKGYFCRPGKLYEDARVCAHLSSKKESK